MMQFDLIAIFVVELISQVICKFLRPGFQQLSNNAFPHAGGVTPHPPVTFSSRKSGCCRRVNSIAIPSSRWRTTRPVVLPMVIGPPSSGR
jgi:hypothetical protein